MSENDKKVHHLGIVKKPTAPELARAEAVACLKEVLAEVESGRIEEVVIIAASPDGEWWELATATRSIAEWLGRLEILKSDWIEAYKIARGEDQD